MAHPNEADFVVNERDGEFYARFRVEGEILLPIKAASLEEARAKANVEIESDLFGLELDEVTMASIDHVYAAPRMFLVTRGGQSMQVSRLEVGDAPREPDARGW